MTAVLLRTRLTPLSSSVTNAIRLVPPPPASWPLSIICPGDMGKVHGFKGIVVCVHVLRRIERASPSGSRTIQPVFLSVMWPLKAVELYHSSDLDSVSLSSPVALDSFVKLVPLAFQLLRFVTWRCPLLIHMSGVSSHLFKQLSVYYRCWHPRRHVRPYPHPLLIRLRCMKIQNRRLRM